MARDGDTALVVGHALRRRMLAWIPRNAVDSCVRFHDECGLAAGELEQLLRLQDDPAEMRAIAAGWRVLTGEELDAAARRVAATRGESGEPVDDSDVGLEVELVDGKLVKRYVRRR